MNKKLIIGILAGVVAVAACAHQQITTSAQSAAYRVMAEGDISGLNKLAEIHKNLGITDAQKEQLKAIAQKYHPAPEEMQAQFETLKGLLLADPFDAQKLREAINTHLAEREARLPKLIEGLTAARNVLTEEQRTKLADMLSKQPPMASKHLEGFKKMVIGRLSSDLKLSETQKNQLESLADKLHRDPQTMETTHKGLADFVRTGNTEGLKAVQENMKAQIPTEDLISFASSLNLSQRQALVQHFEQMKNRQPHFPFRR